MFLLLQVGFAQRFTQGLAFNDIQDGVHLSDENRQV